jgi:hypothetical protein
MPVISAFVAVAWPPEFSLPMVFSFESMVASS